MEKAPFRRSVYESSASSCIMSNKFIFVSGGDDRQRRLRLSEVVRYDITRDVWEDMPSMNEARVGHGCCTHGTAVYFLCGFSLKGYLNSVEKLETLDLQAGWQLIKMPPTSLLTPRIALVTAALNGGEILIMGGMGSDRNILADVLAFDTRDQTVRSIIKAAPFGFSGSKQYYDVSDGVVLALVFKKDRTGNLIEFRNDSIKVLK